MAIEAVLNKEVACKGQMSQRDHYSDNSMKIEDQVSRTSVDSVDCKNRKKQGEKVFDAMTDSEKVMDQSSQVKKAVEEINKSIRGQQTEAIFGIHGDTNRVTIKIVDKKSKEIIKEYPPEQTLDMIAKVWEMAGIMVDEKG